jgi:rhamnulokinase
MPTLFYYYMGNITKADTSWASVTQIMDARKKMWSDEILDRLGIPKEILPEIVRPGTVLGRILKPLADSLGLNQTSLVAVGSHDTASAYAAAPVADPEEALIVSSGTWSLIGKLIPEPITSKQAMEANISNEGGIGNIRFLKNCMGTWLVQELRRVWRDQDGSAMSWEELNKLAKKAEPFSVFVDPDDRSFYNPANMEDAITQFCRRTGQKPPKNRGSFLRTVYESLAMKYRMVKDQITHACGKDSKVMHIVGGGSKNEILNQCAADATGLPVIAGPEEATAVGNIMVQAAGLGIIKGIESTLPLIRHAFKIDEYQALHTSDWQKEYRRFELLVMKGSEMAD